MLFLLWPAPRSLLSPSPSLASTLPPWAHIKTLRSSCCTNRCPPTPSLYLYRSTPWPGKATSRSLKSRGGTEASPLFTVAHWGHGPGFSTSEVVRGIRIERVAPGRRVLVPLPAARTQITGEDREGVRHALLWPGFPRCGVGRLYDASPHTVDTPTCPDCLLLSSGPNMRVWETVYVQPYDSREKRKREEAKEARAQRQRARFPTAFDKLLEDVFDPEAIPEPPPVFSLDPDMLDPTEDYQDERARKLASARRRER